MSKYMVYFKDGQSAEVYADGYDLKQHLKGIAMAYLVFSNGGSAVAYFEREQVRGIVQLPNATAKPAAAKPAKRSITEGY